MQSLNLSKKTKTPEVTFDPEKGKFEILGRSIPENSVDFYQPLLTWLDDYLIKPNDSTRFTVKLEYFNTSSSKCLIDIFRKLESLYLQEQDVVIFWYYEEEDEDMKESGEDFKDILKVPIEMVSYKTT
jgi:hypothetical protein